MSYEYGVIRCKGERKGNHKGDLTCHRLLFVIKGMFMMVKCPSCGEEYWYQLFQGGLLDVTESERKRRAALAERDAKRKK